MFRPLHFAGLFNAWVGDLWSAQSVKPKKPLKLSKKGCTFSRKRDNFKIGIQNVIHLYGIFSGLNTKKQENQGFRKNGRGESEYIRTSVSAVRISTRIHADLSL